MEDSYTIKISTKLINQLARDEDKVKQKVRKPKPKITKEIAQPQDEEKLAPALPPFIQPNISHAVTLLPRPPAYVPVPLPQPSPPTAAPEVDAIRSVLQESEQVLEKLKNEEAHMLEELNRRTKELHDKEFKLPYQNPVPCTAERAGCSDCYRKNPKDPLKCAEAVKRYADCTRLARQGADSSIKQQQ